MISFRAIGPVWNNKRREEPLAGASGYFSENTRSLSRLVRYRIVHQAVEAKYCGTLVIGEILPRKGLPQSTSSPDRMSVD